MAKQKTSEPLTGAALLQKVKTLATLSKTQKAKACGYYTGHEGWWGTRQLTAVSEGPP
jgi:hypothetical protein